MILFCPRTSSALFTLLLVGFGASACSRAEDPSPVAAELASPTAAIAADDAENPFTRRAAAPPAGPCISMSLETTSGTFPASMVISNQCDHAVAVLTAPLELRVRLTGAEPLVHERKSPGAAYAILYAVPADLGAAAFRGDGVARDGGKQVLRQPGYTTVAARGTSRVPVRCDLDVPKGRYLLPAMTFEAPQGDAPVRSDPFDCSQSVSAFNDAAERKLQVTLGGDVLPAQSKSASVELPSPRK